MNLPRWITTIALSVVTVTSVSAQNKWHAPNNMYSYAVVSVMPDTDHVIWAVVEDPSGGAVTYAVQRYDGSAWTTMSTSEHGFPFPATTTLRDVIIAPNNSVLVAGDDAVLQFDRTSQKWQAIGFDDSLAGDRSFQSLFVDSQHRIWVTAEGLMVLKRDTINGIPFYHVRRYQEIFQLHDGVLEKKQLIANVRYHITNPAEDSKGNIWFGVQRTGGSAEGGLIRFDGEHFVSVNVPPGTQATALTGPTCESLHIGQDDSFYLGSSMYGARDSNVPAMVSRFSADLAEYRDMVFPKVWDFFNNGVPVIVSHGGTVFAGTQDGLYDISSGTPRYIDFGNYFPGYSPQSYLRGVNDIAFDGPRMLCATSWGLCEFQSIEEVASVKGGEETMAGALVTPLPAERGALVRVSVPVPAGDRVRDASVFNVLGEQIAAPVRLDDAIHGLLSINTQPMPPGVYILLVRSAGDRVREIRFIVR